MCFGNILGSISGRGLILGIRSGIWGGFRDSALRKLSDKQLINAVLIHLPWAMLLHSGYADHPYSRFDIVVADPICTLTTFGKETVVSESEKRTTTTDDPLQVPGGISSPLLCA